MITKYIIEIDSTQDVDTTRIKARLINSLAIFGKNIHKQTIYEYTEKEYIAIPWPDYQEYIGEDWFLDESFYDVSKDVRLIPKERYDGRL